MIISTRPHSSMYISFTKALSDSLSHNGSISPTYFFLALLSSSVSIKVDSGAIRRYWAYLTFFSPLFGEIPCGSYRLKMTIEPALWLILCIFSISSGQSPTCLLTLVFWHHFSMCFWNPQTASNPPVSPLVSLNPRTPWSLVKFFTLGT